MLVTVTMTTILALAAVLGRPVPWPVILGVPAAGLIGLALVAAVTAQRRISDLGRVVHSRIAGGRH